MGFTEVLILISLILVLVDIFIVSDIPTHLAYILISFAVAIQFEIPILYRILIGIVAWFSMVTFHYVFWRRILMKISDKIIAPRIYKSGSSGLVGRHGYIRNINGQNLVEVEGEIYQFINQSNIDLSPNLKVLIKGSLSTKLII